MAVPEPVMGRWLTGPNDSCKGIDARAPRRLSGTGVLVFRIAMNGASGKRRLC